MTKEEIKDQIVAIIMEAAPNSIVSDDIWSQLTAQVDPGRTQETIRKMITELVNSGEILIGSSSNGYFYIDSNEKLERAMNYILHRIQPLQNRADNLQRMWNEQHHQQED